MPTPIPVALNTLSGGLILIAAFAMVATRQIQGVLRFFVAQSVLLAASSFLLASSLAIFMKGVRSPRQSIFHHRCCWR
jgi:hydrogenase-4 membrane subunit HyfE